MQEIYVPPYTNKVVDIEEIQDRTHARNHGASTADDTASKKIPVQRPSNLQKAFDGQTPGSFN